MNEKAKLFQKLSDEVDQEIESSQDCLLLLSRGMEAFDGDPSQVAEVVDELAEAILNPGELWCVHRYLLVLLLERIAESSAASLAIAGAATRGAPRKGARKMRVAMAVVDELLDGSSETITAAWEVVSKRQSLSYDTVRRYWVEKKEIAICNRGMDFELDDSAVKTTDELVERYLRHKRG